MSSTTEDYLDNLLRQMTDETDNTENVDMSLSDDGFTNENIIHDDTLVTSQDSILSDIDSLINDIDSLGNVSETVSDNGTVNDSAAYYSDPVANSDAADEDITELLSSMNELDNTFSVLGNGESSLGFETNSAEPSSFADNSSDMLFDGLDMANTDLGALLDQVTSQVDDEITKGSGPESADMDLGDLLSGLGEDDSELSAISDLLTKDENSEIVDAGEGSMSSWLSNDSDDGSEMARLLAEESSDDGQKESKEERKKRKKEEKEAKKLAKKEAREAKKRQKNNEPDESSVTDEDSIEGDSFDSISDGFDMFSGNDSDSNDNLDESEDDSVLPSGDNRAKEKKPGFFKRLIDFFTEEDDEEEDNLLDKSAVDIAADGAAENEAIMNDLEGEAADNKGKKKKDKKDKKSKKGKDDSSEDGDGSSSKKDKKEKKEKKKKEKKEKQPEPPLKKLPKKRIIVSSILIASIGAIVMFVSIFFPYAMDIKSARKHYVTGNYQKTYEYLSGHKLSGENKELYKKSLVILKVQRQLDSYRNYMKLGKKTQALNALVQGVDAMDKYQSVARELGVENEFNDAASAVINELVNTFGVSVDQAREWIALEGTDDYSIALYNYIGEPVGGKADNADDAQGNVSPEISIIIQQENEDNEVNSDL